MGICDNELGGRVAVTWWLNPVVFRVFLIPVLCAIHLLFYATCPFTAMASPFLDNCEPLDVIGNGSFGIIRKVRRKTDGLELVAPSCSQAC